MGQSKVVEWLNENELRAYPLESGSPRNFYIGDNVIDLYKLILDANFVYTSTIPTVISLARFSRLNNSLRIGVEGLDTFFVSSGSTYPLYVRNANDDLLVLGDEAEKFFTYLTSGQTVLVNNVSFEPSVAIQMSEATKGVTSVTFNTTLIAGGDIELVEGYQTNINIVDQTINVNVGRNYGLVLPCGNFFDEPQDCGQVISNINGASPTRTGGTIKFVAGEHVKIYEDVERARIYVGLDFEGSDVCPIETLPPAP